MLQRFFQGRRALLTIAVLLIGMLLAGLGNWQWNRHLQRAALNERILVRMAEPPIDLQPTLDPDASEYRRVFVRGTFDHAQATLLRNRAYAGATGFHLLTPLRLADGTALLVDRGWVPYTPDTDRLLQDYHTSGPVQFEGILRRSEAGNPGPADPERGPGRPRVNAWFRVDIERIAQQAGYPLLPFFVEIQPTADQSEQPPIPVATTELGQGPHLGYAFQWYAFAGILLVGYVVVMLRRPS